MKKIEYGLGYAGSKKTGYGTHERNVTCVLEREGRRSVYEKKREEAPARAGGAMSVRQNQWSPPSHPGEGEKKRERCPYSRERNRIGCAGVRKADGFRTANEKDGRNGRERKRYTAGETPRRCSHTGRACQSQPLRGVHFLFCTRVRNHSQLSAVLHLPQSRESVARPMREWRLLDRRVVLPDFSQ
ncbi:hypothetical protein WN55_10156 [Dufourea novaeangliae]|uniref:Uncharacterized protein n=1 Tax=Dufourea novaeangliae TaxID=178035 RepID=A0A154P316_DUFNO|nr:hypothetical protein WN55_10156 [Dufourea novaeangliae]